MTIAPMKGTASVCEHELVEARKRVQVTPEQLAAARRRRELIKVALIAEFGGEVYFAGSLAHGDALHPLTDIDLGVVVPNPNMLYGPSGLGPAALQQRAADAIHRALAREFPRLRVELKGKKRAVLVRFGHPVVEGEADFTADVIVAVVPADGRGLYIPNRDSWDRSDPIGHTAMIKDRNEATRASFAQVVRLVKHWTRRHSDRETGNPPLCSWNVKALALGVIFTNVSMTQGLRDWFRYAAAQLHIGETRDPSGVASEPIHIPKGWTRSEVVTELSRALSKLNSAIEYEAQGYPALAQAELARLFDDPEMMPAPQPSALARDEDRWARMHRQTIGAPIPAAVPQPSYPVRSWGVL